MRVVVSSNGADLEASSSPNFGRCPMYLFVDTESMEFEAAANPGQDSPGGAGIRAAQFVTEAGVQAIVTGKVGPKAMDVLEAAGVPVYLFNGGTVRQAVEDFKSGRLTEATGEKVQPGQGKDQKAKPVSPPGSRDEELVRLKAEAIGIGQKLTGILERIERLQEGS